MSTITKILKTAGVSALCNGVHLYLLKDKSIEFTQAAMGAAFTTLPALAGVGIDKLVNQKFTSNKTTQYGLTAIESGLMHSGPMSSLKVFNFTDLFSPSLKGNCGVSKLLALSTMGQSLAFKAIWDSSDEIDPELDSGIDQQADSSGLNNGIDFSKSLYLKTLSTIGASYIGLLADTFICSLVSQKAYDDDDDYYYSIAFSTIFTALVTVGIDKLVNQKFTSNKTIQYGLTAVENLFITQGLWLGTGADKAFEYNSYDRPAGHHYSVYESPAYAVPNPRHADPRKFDNAANLSLAASAIVKSLILKNIWDLNDATNPELDSEIDQQADSSKSLYLKILSTIGIWITSCITGNLMYSLVSKEHSDDINKISRSTIWPALVTVGVDKFINQNITSNKTTQYGLTALENLVTTGGFWFTTDLFYKFKDYYNSEINYPAIAISLINSIITSLALKHIWEDSSYETNPELNTEIEQQVEEMLEIR